MVRQHIFLMCFCCITYLWALQRVYTNIKIYPTHIPVRPVVKIQPSVINNKSIDSEWNENEGWNTMRHNSRLHKCGVKGRFISADSRNKSLLRHLMWKVRTGSRFAWLRVGDGELLHINQLERVQRKWGETPNMFVAVGLWWMCNSFLSRWNDFADPLCTYLDYFYLPMGDPGDNGGDDQRRFGVLGWIVEAKRNLHPVGLIGPSFLRRLPFVDIYIDERETDASILRKIQTQNRATIFAVSKGTHAKRIISLAFQQTNRHSFVDVGRALNPYAGRAEFGRDVKYYCLRANSSERDFWFAHGVCHMLHREP